MLEVGSGILDLPRSTFLRSSVYLATVFGGGGSSYFYPGPFQQSILRFTLFQFSF